MKQIVINLILTSRKRKKNGRFVLNIDDERFDGGASYLLVRVRCYRLRDQVSEGVKRQKVGTLLN